MKAMKVNVISESEFLPKGHGVHTAYLNHVAMLKKLKMEVVVNSLKKTHITHLHTVGPLALHKLLTSKKTVVSAHVIPASFEGSLVGTDYWLGSAKKYLRFFYNKANLVLAVAPKVKYELEKIGVTQRIKVFPNAIDVTVFRNDEKLRMLGRRHFGLSSDEKIVLGVGQVQPRKGVEDFVKLANKLPEFKFIWVGTRPFKVLTAQGNKLNHLLRYPPKNLLFIEEVSYRKMPEIYSAADIFFFPSYQENASMAIIEAASSGLPLVLRDLEEYRLLYKKGYMASGKTKDFRAYIMNLFSDRNFFEQQKKEALNLAKKFSYETLGNKLLEHYEKLT